MFEKEFDDNGNVVYEHEQCRAVVCKKENTIYLPFLMGYSRGLIPIKDGGLHAKDLLSWLVNETGINKFVVISVLDPEDYAKKLHGIIVPTVIPKYKFPDLRVHFTWEPKKYKK